MRNSVVTWPFQPLASLSPEYQERWLNQCYVPSECDDLLLDAQRSVVVIAPHGSGLSTSFSWLEHRLTQMAAQRRLDRNRPRPFLSFFYPPDRWPGEPRALVRVNSNQSHPQSGQFVPINDHLSQFVGHIIRLCIDEFKAQPAKLFACSDSLYAGFIWLLKEYLGLRRYESWRRAVEELLPASDTAEYAQLAPKLLNPSGNYRPPESQDEIVNDCRDLVEYLGWDGIYALIDLSTIDWVAYSRDARQKIKEGLELLLTDLRWLEETKIGIKIGLPQMSYAPHEIKDMLRGRATITTYTWKFAQLKHMAESRIAVACNVQLDLNNIFSPSDWALLIADIEGIWGNVCPTGILAIAEYIAMHYETLEPNLNQAQPVKEHEALAASPSGQAIEGLLHEVRVSLYTRFAVLRREIKAEETLLWRGAMAFKLDETPRKLFDLLWSHHGNLVTNQQLHHFAGSSQGADKQLSRLRQMIEPFCADGHFIYIQRVHSYGVYLNKLLCKF